MSPRICSSKKFNALTWNCSTSNVCSTFLRKFSNADHIWRRSINSNYLHRTLLLYTVQLITYRISMFMSPETCPATADVLYATGSWAFFTDSENKGLTAPHCSHSDCINANATTKTARTCCHTRGLPILSLPLSLSLQNERSNGNSTTCDAS